MRLVMDDVVQDFPSDVTFTGEERGDYHVHAAAIAVEAGVIVTNNRSGDITTTPADEPYVVMSPDAFFCAIGEANPRCLPPIVKEQRTYWARRSAPLNLGAALERAGCPRFAETVREVERREPRA